MLTIRNVQTFKRCSYNTQEIYTFCAHIRKGRLKINDLSFYLKKSYKKVSKNPKNVEGITEV